MTGTPLTCDTAIPADSGTQAPTASSPCCGSWRKVSMTATAASARPDDEHALQPVPGDAQPRDPGPEQVPADQGEEQHRGDGDEDVPARDVPPEHERRDGDER